MDFEDVDIALIQYAAHIAKPVLVELDRSEKRIGLGRHHHCECGVAAVF